MKARLILLIMLALLPVINTGAIVFTNLYTFSPGTFNTPMAGGYYPQADLLLFSNALYGTTAAGGSNNVGTVFVYSLSRGFANLYTFNGKNGAAPQADLVASGQTLFGTTAGGGTYGGGTIFAVNTNGTGFTNLFDFAFTNGAAPQAGLVLSGGTLFGTTSKGGAYGAGTLFAISTNGTGFTNLFNFAYTNGANPKANLLLLVNTLYGTTVNGGNGWGTIFAINTNGMGFTNLFSFSLTNGADPQAGLALVRNALCGTTYEGGVAYDGTVFLIATNGTGFNVLYNFGTNAGDGFDCESRLAVFSNSASSYSLYGTCNLGSATVPNQGTVFKINLSGPGLTFSGYSILNTSGANYPPAGVVLSGNGAILYGTGEGTPPLISGNGTIFSMGSGGGSSTTLYSFTTSTSYATTNRDGALPVAGLVSSGNTLYGTASAGGVKGSGTVFAVNMDGTTFTNLQSLIGGTPWAGLTLSGDLLYGTTLAVVYQAANLYSGSGSSKVFTLDIDGSGFRNIVNLGTTEDPQASLVLTNGILFGTTQFGGSGFEGEIFTVNTNGAGPTNFYNFSFNTGLSPAAGLTLNGDTFYGAARGGGSSDYGVIFSINTDGTGYTNFFNFSGTNGSSPLATLILSGNTLYGTTEYDLDRGYGTIFAVNTDGSDFTNLYIFNGYDGANPVGSLVLSNNVLYGTTMSGGSGGFGTVFAINTDGTGFITLYNFSGGWDGATPDGDGLVLSGNTLYGTTSSGGSSGNGTVFALSLGPIPSNIMPGNGNIVLTWGNPAFSLQSAPTVNGPYTTVSGAASPWTNSVTGSEQFFRLEAP
ncbi:MAG TPA: choice-of-anchor tandem repeat GloVer-containing protein [Verrucomicrobiae bacterium]